MELEDEERGLGVRGLAQLGYGAFAGFSFLGAYAFLCYQIALAYRDEVRVVGWPVLLFIIFNVLMVIVAIWLGARVAEIAESWISGPGAILGIAAGVIFALLVAATIFFVLAIYATVVEFGYLIGTVVLFGYIGARD